MFDSDGVAIQYTVTGEGRPLVLLHGWANSYQENWVDTGWVEALSPLRQIIGVDQRGHGKSDKPHDPGDYTNSVMARDVVRLLDHLDIEEADVFGYSMGAAVTLALLAEAPTRVSGVVVGGIGINIVEQGAASKPLFFAPMAQALLAADSATVTVAPLRAMRDLYAAKGNDLAALAAWLQSDHFAATRDQLAAVSVPVLVANAEGDAEGAQVAAAIAGAQFESIPGTNHITVVADPRLKDRVVRFLGEIDSI